MDKNIRRHNACQRRVRLPRICQIVLLGLLAASAIFAWPQGSCQAQGDKQPSSDSQSQRSFHVTIPPDGQSLIGVELPLPESVELIEGVQYGRASDIALRLDLYRPKNISQPTAGLVFIHGGGWAAGRRKDYRYYGIKLAEKGYVVASISYRLRDVAPFPAAVEDAKCAVRWLRAHAEQYQIDPERIAVAGGSAGGHLAMMVGYSSDIPPLEGNGGYPKVSSRVQVVVDFYGPVDLTTQFARQNSLVVNFLGKPYDEAAQVYQQASPLSYITADDPPTLIFHGSSDRIVPIHQAEVLVEALKKAGVAYQFHRLEGWSHGMDLARAVNDYCLEHMLQFFQAHLVAHHAPR